MENDLALLVQNLGHMLSEQHPSRLIYTPEVSCHIAKISLEIDNKILTYCNKDALTIHKSNQAHKQCFDIIGILAMFLLSSHYSGTIRNEFIKTRPVGQIQI